MISSVQHFQALVTPIDMEGEQKFRWNKETKNIFNSACLALIYLNGGKLELSKERVTHGKVKRALFPQAIEHILQRGNFPVFKTFQKKELNDRLCILREGSRKRGGVWEEKVLKQYQELEGKTLFNEKGEKIPAILQELSKFGIQQEEFDQWLPIEGCFQWDEEREAIFTSACFALIYLNGGKVELSKERVNNGQLKSALFPQAMEHILQRGDFSLFKTLPKRGIETHFQKLRERSKKRGSTWEEEISKQYQELEAKTIVNNKGKEIPALLLELGKFGVKPQEYDQWIPIETCFKWDEEREQIFTSACLALIYLNGGKVELSKERALDGCVKNPVSPKTIGQMLERGDFPVFRTCTKSVIHRHLYQVRGKSKKRGTTWEEELLKQYQDLEEKTIVNSEGREIPALWQELSKFGIQPEEQGAWLEIEPSSRTNPRKRLAEESPDPEAEPAKKRANHSSVSNPRVNQVTNLRQAIEDIMSEIIN